MFCDLFPVMDDRDPPGRPRPPAPHGRGSASNPPNRFEPLHFEPDPAVLDEDPDRDIVVATRYFCDTTRTVIVRNSSPDVGFDAGVNPYRGCSVGCAYCYARSYHEYLGLSPGLDFETSIFVKHDAPALLAREIASPRHRPGLIHFSGVTDCYQPVERHLRITRGCLEVLAAARNAVTIITKNRLVTRETDLLAPLAALNAAAVGITITTLDPGLARRLEPRASAPSARLETIATLARAGIPAGVFVCPVIPGLTDHELPAILRAARDAGARFAVYGVLRLAHGLGALFDDWLARNEPGRRSRVMNGVRELHDGTLAGGGFDTRNSGTGPRSAHLAEMFHKTTARLGLAESFPELDTSHFIPPGGRQTSLFG